MVKAKSILLAQVHSVAWQKQASSLLPAFGLTAVPATRTTATRDYLARWDGYSAFHAITLSPALSQTRQWLWDHIPARSEDRRLGKGWVRPVRSRWSADH